MKKKKIVQRTFISLGLIVVFIYMGIAVSDMMAKLKKKPQKKEEAKTLTVVKTQIAAKQMHTEKLKGYGVTRAMQDTQVSAQVTGIVKWVSPDLKLGQQIQIAPGERKKLIEIDDRDIRQRYIAAKSNLEKANYALKALEIEIQGNNRLTQNAKREWEMSLRELGRQKLLIQEQGISASDLDRQLLETSLREKEVVQLELQKNSQKNAKESSLSDIKLMQSQLQQVENDLEKTTIYAPYSGSIVEKNVSLGTRVAPGTEMFRILNMSKIEMAISLPSSHYNNVRVGAKAIATVDNRNSYKWKGRVARISPEVDSRTRTFQAFIEIKQNKTIIPSGIFALAKVEGKRYNNIFVIPRSAVIDGTVFIARRLKTKEININADKAIVEQKQISIEASIAENVLVSEGISEGDEIVVTNIEEIATGIVVRISKK